MKKQAFRTFRLPLLALAATLTGWTMIPASPAEAASCGSWQYFGCCYTSTRVTMKQQRTCCDNGYCYNQTRCTTSLCPV